MHRHQKPHTRGAASHPNNNPNNNHAASPPSMKRPPFHRHTSSSSVSSTSSNKTSPSTTTASKKGSAVKSTRPPVHHRKSASAHQVSHHHRRNKSHQSLGKLLGAGSGPASHSVDPEDEQLEMATSFLQYCAMCEKQITVPSNSVLYCSESCRRKDSCKPLSASSYTYTMTSPSSSPINMNNTHINMDTSSSSSSITSPSKPIPMVRPTISSLGRIPSDLHDSQSDLDPTEWKPIISEGRHGRNGSSTSLASSDAWTYLSQFHYHRDDAGISSSTPSTHAMMSFRRAPTTRNSTTSLSTMGTPSLVNTPSTTTASSSVTSSPPSSSGDYISAAAAAAASYNYGAYTYAADSVAAVMDPGRPLPPRHNPSFSTSAGATKGVELVVPHIITSADEDGHTHEGLWMKAGF